MVQILAGLIGGLISGIMIQIPLLDSTDSIEIPFIDFTVNGIIFTVLVSFVLLLLAAGVFYSYKALVDRVDPSIDLLVRVFAVIILLQYAIILPIIAVTDSLCR